MNELALLVAVTLSAGTPLAIAGMGLLINERVGVLNLGAEGMMLVAAVSGFAVAFHSGSASSVGSVSKSTIFVLLRRFGVGSYPSSQMYSSLYFILVPPGLGPTKKGPRRVVVRPQCLCARLRRRTLDAT